MSWNSFQLNIFREPNMAGGTYNTLQENMFVKFVFSKKATKFDKIFTVDLTHTTYCQIDGEDFVNFCGLLRKYEL